MKLVLFILSIMFLTSCSPTKVIVKNCIELPKPDYYECEEF